MEKQIIVKWPAKTIVDVDDKSITINRKGLMNFATQGLKGNKTIPFRSITSIQIKKPGLANGYIQFSLLGGGEAKKGITDAAHDENTIMFTSKSTYEQMIELKSFIESKQDQFETNSSNVSSADELRKYKQLLDDEIINQEEYDAKKKQLLGI